MNSFGRNGAWDLSGRLTRRQFDEFDDDFIGDVHHDDQQRDLKTRQLRAPLEHSFFQLLPKGTMQSFAAFPTMLRDARISMPAIVADNLQVRATGEARIAVPRVRFPALGAEQALV